MKSFLWVLQFVKPFKGLVLQLSLAVVVMAINKQVVPLVSSRVVDTVQAYLQEEIELYRVWEIIVPLFGLTLVFAILNWLAGRISWRQAMILQERMKGYIRYQTIKHLLSLDLTFFDKQTSGNVMSKVDRGINKIVAHTGETSSFFMPTILAAILSIGVIFTVMPELVLLIFVSFVPFIIINLWAIRKHEPLQKKFNKIYDEEYGRFWEVLSSIRLVKSFVRQGHELKKLASMNKKIYRLNSKVERVWDYASVRDLFLDIWFWRLNVYLVVALVNTEISLGQYFLLVQYSVGLREPLWNLSWMYFEYKKMLVGAKDLMKIFNKKSKIRSGDIRLERGEVSGAISIKDIDFEYSRGQKVFEKLSLEVQSGQTVALVGKSGSGKTTLTNLITRFYEVNSGDILLDGLSIKNIDIDSLREKVGIVFQDAYLFDDTIEANLLYGDPKASEEKIIRACKMANAWEFIEKLDKGLKTKIGERGVKLSGGQKQRLSIARTILKNPPILIFDEATSSLDSESEKIVQDAVNKLIKNRTTIIVAHRLSTIRSADLIVVLGDGNIIEQGNHDELIRKGGIYAKLYNLQSSHQESKLLGEYELV